MGWRVWEGKLQPDSRSILDIVSNSALRKGFYLSAARTKTNKSLHNLEKSFFFSTKPFPLSFTASAFFSIAYLNGFSWTWFIGHQTRCLLEYYDMNTVPSLISKSAIQGKVIIFCFNELVKHLLECWAERAKQTAFRKLTFEDFDRSLLPAHGSKDKCEFLSRNVRQINQNWYWTMPWTIFKQICDVLISCWFLFVLHIPDANHFSVKVQKAATPDLWDLGVLIHNFFITDVTREDL